jgi:oligoendopeptidase F
MSEILHAFSSASEPTRKAAAYAFSKGLEEKISLFTFITNTLAKDKQVNDTLRGYTHPVASRNISNRIEDSVVDALAQAVRKRYPSLTHRYYALKAKWLEKEKLEFWDRLAPPPFVAEKKIPWEQGKDIVLRSYREFSPLMADIAMKFFDEHWIDAAPKVGKYSGAFSHGTIPSLHPYILLNYQGTLRDVATMAHELGHGIHQYLSREKGILLSDTPLTIAETASVFGEMLTFQNLLKQCTTPLDRKALLANKVEDMLSTVARQIAFFDFELQVHQRRQQKELTSEDLGDLWIQKQTEVLGPVFNLSPAYRPYWSYISHFIHSPFYVYAYAFGDCLVNSLYVHYQNHPEGFADQYLNILKAGGTLRHKEILAPFGLDANDPTFWDKGLDLISQMIDELEK